MSDKYIVTPKYVYEEQTSVIHASSAKEAATIATRKHIETGIPWDVYERLGTPEVSAEVFDDVVQENIRLRAAVLS